MNEVKKLTRRSSRLDLFEDAVQCFSKKRAEGIKKSLIRPLHHEMMRCFFIVVVMIIDVFVPLQILIDASVPYSYVFSVIMLLILLYFELKIYDLIWGEKGCWSLRDAKKRLR